LGEWRQFNPVAGRSLACSGSYFCGVDDDGNDEGCEDVVFGSDGCFGGHEMIAAVKHGCIPARWGNDTRYDRKVIEDPLLVDDDLHIMQLKLYSCQLCDYKRANSEIFKSSTGVPPHQWNWWHCPFGLFPGNGAQCKQDIVILEKDDERWKFRLI
jgi:hypothetical protein